ESLALAGAALTAISGSNSWAGPIRFTNTALISVATNVVLNLSGAIAGPGGLTEAGDGLLILSGNTSNTYSGPTTVNQGALLLTKTSSNAVPGALIVGDGTG